MSCEPKKLPVNSVMRERWRELLMVAIIVVSFVVIFCLPAIRQDTTYHNFADAREFWSVPNFFDVATNLPFLFVGGLGLFFCLQRKDLEARSAWVTLFVAVALVFVGSSYYHWAPSNTTLVWDRLPMAVGFMALLTALLTDYLDRRCSRLLVPLVLLGVISVFYWHWTDDLRLYAWVQFFPLMCVLILLALFKPRNTKPRYLLVAFAFYWLAKLFEWADAPLYGFFGDQLSGHSIKHLSAAAGALCVALMLYDEPSKESKNNCTT
jgi:hypothetical protein